MKRFIIACLCAGALLGVNSCGGPESDGHSSYNTSKKYQGDQRRMFEKKAYRSYKEAIAASPDKITPKLRSRFVELAVSRAMMMLVEGSYNSESVTLIQEEIDKYWGPEVTDEVKDAYGSFLALLCDSGFEHKHVLKGLERLDKAITVSADKQKFAKAKQDRIAGFIEQYLAMGKASFEQGKANKDPEELVRAEYYAKMVLFFDSTNADAKTLLGQAFSENRSTYSLYKKVIEDYPDTALFKKVNWQDIFFAVVTTGKSNMVVTMWNYSYNPQRLKAESFYLIDEKGNKYPALASSKLQPEFLKFEMETKLTLNFASMPDKIYKLMYDNPPHHAEKQFY